MVSSAASCGGVLQQRNGAHALLCKVHFYKDLTEV